MLEKVLPWWPVVKNLPCNAGNTSLIPGPGRYHICHETTKFMGCSY